MLVLLELKPLSNSTFQMADEIERGLGDFIQLQQLPTRYTRCYSENNQHCSLPG